MNDFSVSSFFEKRPDIKKDIKPEVKQFWQEEHQATSIDVKNIKEEQGCIRYDITIGDVIIDNRVLTCDFESERIIWGLKNPKCKPDECEYIPVDLLTVEELIEADSQKILNAHYAAANNSKSIIDEKGFEKDWNTGVKK